MQLVWERDRERKGTVIALTGTAAGVGSHWGGLAGNGQGLGHVHSGSKERSAKCVRREKYVCGGGGDRELQGQEENTVHIGVCWGQQWEGGRWNKDLLTSIS